MDRDGGRTVNYPVTRGFVLFRPDFAIEAHNKEGGSVHHRGALRQSTEESRGITSTYLHGAQGDFVLSGSGSENPFRQPQFFYRQNNRITLEYSSPTTPKRDEIRCSLIGNRAIVLPIPPDGCRTLQEACGWHSLS
jgi:hypothetical protein